MSAVPERIELIAGLRTTLVGTTEPEKTVVVLLHGYDMKPSDLAPFAHSMKIPALFLLPQGAMRSPSGAYAWWTIDTEARARALSTGPRDLASEHPPGAPAARKQLSEFLQAVRGRYQPRRLVLAGFSQGGMLACDLLLEERPQVDALLLLSSSRIRMDEWQLRSQALNGLPMFLSHGRTDPDLAFAAGERLRDFAEGAGARVTWVPFEGGHEIPLIVWRELRKFIGALLK